MRKIFSSFLLLTCLTGCFVYTGSLPPEELVGRKDYPLDKDLFDEHEAKYYDCVEKLRLKDGNAHLKLGYTDSLRKCVGRPMSTVIACKISADAEYYASASGNGKGQSDVDASFHSCLARQNDPIGKCFYEGSVVAQDCGSTKQGDRTTRLCLEKILK